MTNDEFDNYEIAIERRFLSVLRKQTKTFFEYANKNGIDNAVRGIDSLIKVDDLRLAYISVFIRYGEEIAKKNYKDLSKITVKRQAPPTIAAGFFSELWKKFVVQYANSALITTRILKINETTKQSIKDAIANNPLNGAVRISKDIRNDVAGINQTRALLIARTELTHVNGVSSQFGAEYSETISGVQLEKGWSARIDGRERPEHATANNQFVLLRKDFVVGGLPMSYPGDPKGGALNCCNCRCTLIYRVAKQVEEIPILQNVSPRVNRFGNFVSGLVNYLVGREVLEEVNK